MMMQLVAADFFFIFYIFSYHMERGKILKTGAGEGVGGRGPMRFELAITGLRVRSADH